MTDYETLHEIAKEKMNEINYKGYHWIQTKGDKKILRIPGRKAIDLDC